MITRMMLAALAAVSLSACGGSFETGFETAIPASQSAGWRVADVQVAAPQTLTVSERNVMAPDADIVWHGDPEGDRRAQAAAIIRDGMARGAAPLQGPRPVILSATLQEFHGITPRAVSRAPSGVHNITFTARVFDAATGVPLTEPALIHADLEANVGAAAIIASQEGRTQKVRIRDHIAAVTAAWLSIGPDIRRNFVTLGR